jgi:hypothetical protein
MEVFNSSVFALSCVDNGLVTRLISRPSSRTNRLQDPHLQINSSGKQAIGLNMKGILKMTIIIISSDLNLY